MKLWSYDFTGAPRECQSEILMLLDPPPSLPPEHRARYQRSIVNANADVAGLPSTWERIRVRIYGTGGDKQMSIVHIARLDGGE